MKILVPLDFSEPSLNALETAVCMAQKLKAKLLLLNVFDTSDLFGNNNYAGPDLVKCKSLDLI